MGLPRRSTALQGVSRDQGIYAGLAPELLSEFDFGHEPSGQESLECSLSTRRFLRGSYSCLRSGRKAKAGGVEAHDYY